MKRIPKITNLTISIILNLFLCGFLIYQYNYIKKIESALNSKFKTDNRILFIGNSIFERNDWAKTTHNPNVVNLGVGGITSLEISLRLNDLLMGYPKKVFFEMGSNDINKGAGLQDIINNFYTIISDIRLASPLTKIYILSVLPVNRDFGGGNVGFITDNEKVDQLNETLLPFCKKYGLIFVEVNSLLKDTNGNLAQEYTVDGAHLTDLGYNKIMNKISSYVNE